MKGRVSRPFTGRRLVLATHNPGKLREIAGLLAPYDVEITGAAALGLPEPKETGASFRANARLKARAAATAAGTPALADDSGLVVDELDGAPGIHSARWAGASHDFAAAMRRVEQELERRRGKGRASGAAARFVCALALAWPDGHTETFEGTVEGTLRFPPRGARGFGYDPIFVPRGEPTTFGEMEPERKHAMSHRARAFRALIEACFKPERAAARPQAGRG